LEKYFCNTINSNINIERKDNSLNYKKDRVENINIAYIGGGSRGWAWTLMGDLALEEKLSGNVRLYDIDNNASYDNEIIGNNVTKKINAKGKWKYNAVKSLKEALTGVDFVLISILPGTFDEMESDVHLPEKYGIYQSVGDTVGPGGIIRALRTIPMFVEIVEAIKKYSPNAWVINFTNPMSICVRTLYKVFPEIHAYGCCHEVFHTQELLIDMLKDMKNITGIKREDIKVNILGINHFTWLDEATYQGIDLISLYEKFVDKYYRDGFTKGSTNHWMNSFWHSAEKVKFDLYKRYGLIAAAGDRHLAEFVPSSWYLKDPETVEKWEFHLTPVSWRKEHKKELIEKAKRLVNGKEEFKIEPSGEEAVKQIKAILGLEDLVTNVNLPNLGQLTDFPKNVIVETNALFRKNSVKPIAAGSFPKEIHNMEMTHVLNQETVVEAVLNEDIEKVFRAFLNDPLVIGASLDRNDARELFDNMVKNTKEYIPWIK